MLAEAALNRYAAVQEQNQRLQRLLDVQRSLGLGAQLARLIDVDPGPFHRRIVLNLGSTDGVAVNQAVIDATGVMGQIVETLPHTSTVMLITNPAHAIPVAIERTGLRTIAKGGSNADTLELPNIPISADVKIGDRLITSGLGGIYPAGFPVGEIRAIANDVSGMFAAALATPSAALDRSGEVLVLHQVPDAIGPPDLAPANGPPESLAGDAQAAEQMELYCDRLARALSVVINIVDPHAIVLGGGLSRMAPLYSRVPEFWKKYIFSEPDLIVTKLLPPRFGDSSGVRGAAWLWPA